MRWRRPAGIGLALLAGAALTAVERATRDPARDDSVPPGGLRVLHLAFEDHRRPGSGGGGLRTHEINRRMASRHAVTVLTVAYRGATERVEDGVRYRPLGWPAGYYGSIITYHLLTPLVLLRARPDLVVEDFGAPMSSMLAPVWTPRPVVAVVQWLFAAEVSRRYWGVPFHLLETLGLRVHTRFVAASGYMAERIRAVNADAEVSVVYAGVEPAAAPAGDAGGQPAGVLYLGRLQEQAKGLELLVEAFAEVLRDVPDATLTIAGDGPFRPGLERLVERAGIAAATRFTGRVEGARKWDLLRSAAVLAVPSRYESFGLVALEAMAAGTPVAAFDLAATREVVTSRCGELAEPFDPSSLAGGLRRMLTDPAERRRKAADGRERAALFDWDIAAKTQEQVYLAAAETAASRARDRRRLTPGAGR